MKRTIIKGYHSPDVNFGTLCPFEKEDFGFFLQVFVGVDNEPGEECFDVFICTPRWIEQHYSKQTIVLGLHSIIVQEYDYQRIIRAIEELFCTEGVNWEEVSNDLSFYGQSEMNYKHWIQFKNSVKCGVISDV